MYKQQYWALGIGALILILVGIALIERPASPAADSTASSTTATTTVTQGGVSANGDFTISGDTVNLKIPDYRAPIQFSNSIQADVKAALQKAANTLAEKLSSNSFDIKSWMDLGTVRKMAGDYKGAESAWHFVEQAVPKDPTVHFNLGDLNATYLKNFPKAEQEFLTSLSLNPLNEGAYMDLYVMYKNSYKKTTSAAEDILKKGIAALPNSVTLHLELARYYKEKGATAEAKKQYDAAIAAAKATNQPGVAAEIQAESEK